MKKQVQFLLALLVLMSVFSVQAQVGIGTDLPNSSAQLDVVSQDRGILISRVKLESTTDQTTITNGNIESLLVYNAATQNDVRPGYYYWYNGKWRRLIDEEETVTEFFENPDQVGEFLYVNEAQDTASIDVPSAIVQNIQNEGDVYSEILNLIDESENITLLEDNGDGTYTYYNENEVDADGDPISGEGTTIDVTGDVVNNIQNQGDIYNEITNILETQTDSLVDHGDGTFTHTAADGTVVTFDANTTAFTDNGDGTYTFTNANGDTMLIDTNANQINFDNTNNNFAADNVQDALEELRDSLQSGHIGVELIDNNDGTITLFNDAGDNLGTVDKADLTDNGNGKYEFDNGDGNPVTMDVIGDVVDNITNNSTIYDEITNILETQTDSLVDNGDGTFTHTAADGTAVTFDANTTAFTDNGDGTYTFTNANGDTMLIDTNADQINFDNTNNNFAADNVQDALEELQDSLQSGHIGVELINNNDGTITLFNDAGDNLGTVDKADLTDNGNGEYEFDNGDGNPVTIDVIGDVVDNITNNSAIYNEITNILETQTDSLVDHGDGTFTHTAADGTAVTFDANTTAFTDNGDGTYTFTNANGDTMDIDLPTAMVNQFDEIINGGPVVVNGNTYNSVQDYFEAAIKNNETLTVLTDNGDGTFTYTDEDGNDVIFDTNTTAFTDNGDGSYTFTNANGDTMTINTNADNINFDNTNNNLASDNVQDALEELATDLADGAGVTLNDNSDGTFTLESENGDDLGTITKSNLTNAGDGSYTFSNGDGNDIDFDVKTVDVSFNATTNEYEFKDSEGNVIGTIDMNADNVAYDNNTSGLTGTDVQTALDELAGQSDSLVDNGDGTYKHTAVDGTEITIDANTTSVTETDGVYTFTDAAGNSITTIDTKASASGYNNTNSGLTAENVQGAIDELVNSLESGAGVELVDNADGTVTLKSENRDDLGTITKSDLVDNGDGTYTFNNTGDPADDVMINIPASMLNQFDEIINGGPVEVAGNTYTTVEEYFKNLIEANETLTELTYDPAANELSFKDEDETTHNIQLNNTSLTYDEISQELVYLDSNGNTSTIDLNNLVNSNINTGDLVTGLDERIGIVNGTDALLHDVKIDVNEANLRLQKIGGTLQVEQIQNGQSGQILVTNEGGNGVTWADPIAIAKGDLSSSDIDVSNGEDAILRDVSLEIKNGAITTDKIASGSNDQVMTTDDSGNVTWEDQINMVSGNETLTVLTDNGNGTFTYTDENGVDFDFDANTTSVTETNGIYTFTDGDGNLITTIDTKADAIAFDNSTNGFTSDNVQEALEELATDLADGAGVTLTDNTDGTFTLESENGNVLGTITKSNLTDAGGGSYTFSNGDGNDIDFDVKTVDVSFNATKNKYEFKDSEGIVIGTIDMNADNLAYDNGTSGLTATEVQGALDEIANRKGDLTVDGGLEFIGGTDGLNKLLANAGIQIADGGITTDKIADDAVTNDKVGADAITSDKIQDGTVKAGDMATAGNEQVLTTDGSGNPQWADQSDLEVTADNGLTKTDGNIQLGGTLNKPTEIKTDATNTLAVKGLQQGQVTDNVMVVGTNGTLKKVNAVMPKFFYMPSVIMPTNGSQISGVNDKYDSTPYNESGGTYTVDLYELYQEQFGMSGSHSVSSDATNSDLPVLSKSELIYNITWFDSDVFDNVSLNGDGKLTYTIISSATIDVATFMNIVFEVK